MRLPVRNQGVRSRRERLDIPALCLAWTSGGQIQFWSSPDGTFSSGQPTAVAESAQAPALGVLNNQLYLALIRVMAFGKLLNVPLIELKFSFDGQNFFP